MSSGPELGHMHTPGPITSQGGWKHHDWPRPIMTKALVLEQSGVQLQKEMGEGCCVSSQQCLQKAPRNESQSRQAS